MKLEAKVTIQGSREQVWSVITDIENSSSTIRGINENRAVSSLDQVAVGRRHSAAVLIEIKHGPI